MCVCMCRYMDGQTHKQVTDQSEVLSTGEEPWKSSWQLCFQELHTASGSGLPGKLSEGFLFPFSSPYLAQLP